MAVIGRLIPVAAVAVLRVMVDSVVDVIKGSGGLTVVLSRLVGLLGFIATMHYSFTLILAASLIPLYVVETRVGIRIFEATRRPPISLYLRSLSGRVAADILLLVCLIGWINDADKIDINNGPDTQLA